MKYYFSMKLRQIVGYNEIYGDAASFKPQWPIGLSFIEQYNCEKSCEN